MRVDLTPAYVPWTATVGDSLVPVAFTLLEDGVALTPSSARAQIRAGRASASAVILALTVDLSTNTVTVGDGDDLDDVDPGVYWWSLEIVTAGYPSGLTLASGPFEVLDDGNEVIV